MLKSLRFPAPGRAIGALMGSASCPPDRRSNFSQTLAPLKEQDRRSCAKCRAYRRWNEKAEASRSPGYNGLLKINLKRKGDLGNEECT